jgi:hypothetical protein
MPVKQLDAPCWYATYPGGEDYQNSVHYDFEAEARKAAAEITDEDALRQVTVGSYPEPCLTAVCDGKPGEPCGEVLGSDEFAWLHFDSPEAGREFAETEGWRITADGVVTCPQDLEEEASG